MGFLSAAKDRALEQLALAYLNGNLLAPYGRATNLHLDSTAKSIVIEAELKGEALPLRVEITDYEIRQEENRCVARLKGIRTSREWLTQLARRHLLDVSLELPAHVGRWLLRTL